MTDFLNLFFALCKGYDNFLESPTIIPGINNTQGGVAGVAGG